MLLIPPTAVGGLFRSFLERGTGGMLLIPPTAVGGLFRSFLQLLRSCKNCRNPSGTQVLKRPRECLRKDLNNPPTAVGGISKVLSGDLYRKDLKNPPTTMGGILDF
jgi:hypothetical protein